jgi:hypothetical protein
VGEHVVIDRSEHIGDKVSTGRHSVRLQASGLKPQGPVYGRMTREVHRSFRRVDTEQLGCSPVCSWSWEQTAGTNGIGKAKRNIIYHHQDQLQTKFTLVKTRKLQILPEKLARYGLTRSDRPSREFGEKRRKEPGMLGRVYPGENR